VSETLFLVAGEASSDMHAARVLAELRAIAPGVECFGVGGSNLRAEGMDVVADARRLGIVGLFGGWGKVRDALGAYSSVKRAVRVRGASVALLMDLPDFNLTIARELRRLGVPIVYYISPQVWAWRKYRVRKIRRLVHRMLVVFPFEREFYQAHGIPAEFVGHPLLEVIEPRESFRPQEQIAYDPVIAMLPGSRASELRQHATLLRDTGERIRQRYPRARLVVPVASTLSEGEVREAFPEPWFELEIAGGQSALRQADLALVASGTATLEAALVGTPFCLFYRLGWASRWAFDNIVRYRGFLGMPNLLLGQEVVRELLNSEATAENLFEECRRLIEDKAARDECARSLTSCREILAGGHASRLVAERLVEVAGW